MLARPRKRACADPLTVTSVRTVYTSRFIPVSRAGPAAFDPPVEGAGVPLLPEPDVPLLPVVTAVAFPAPAALSPVLLSWSSRRPEVVVVLLPPVAAPVAAPLVLPPVPLPPPTAGLPAAGEGAGVAAVGGACVGVGEGGSATLASPLLHLLHLSRTTPTHPDLVYQIAPHVGYGLDRTLTSAVSKGCSVWGHVISATLSLSPLLSPSTFLPSLPSPTHTHSHMSSTQRR